MRTSFYICLETGRSATQKQEPPIRPSFTRKDYETGAKKKHYYGMAFQTITKHGDIGADIRSMLVAGDGYCFIQADLSQAEARVVTLLADDLDTLALYDTHDIHALTASWFFGGIEDNYSKKVLGYECPERFAGKTLRHAGHLGASKRRASIEINTQARKYKINYTLSERSAEKALKIFHDKFPKLKQVYHESVIKALEKNRRLRAPIPSGIKAPSGGIRIFYERWGDELNRQAFSYIPQRSVSEHTKAAAIRIRTNHRWIKIVNEAHDALLAWVPKERAEECAAIMRNEMQQPLDFSNCTIERGKLIIPSDIEIGYNYQDLSKFKFTRTS
jgi:DNA polymerase I-like protein with 3'-5' exonuclease and polymerase domains